MKNHLYKLGFMMIFAFTLNVHCTDVCSFIKYKNPDVLDKPELIITKVRTEKVNESWTTTDGICHIGAHESNPKFLMKPNLTSSNYDFVLIEHDPYDDTLYELNYQGELHKIYLKNKIQTVSHQLKLFSELVEYMSLDWITKNLYFVHTDSVHVINLKNSSKTAKRLFTAFDARRVKVFPQEGYLIISRLGDVARLDQDGLNPKILYKNSSVHINQIALDYDAQKIYWIEHDRGYEDFYKRGHQRIRHVSLHGGIAATFEIKNSSNDAFDTNYLFVDGGYIYYVTKLDPECIVVCRYHLVRARKSDGAYDHDFEVLHGYGEFKNILILKKKNPCVIDECDHDHVCVAVHDETQTMTQKCVGDQDYLYSWANYDLKKDDYA